MSFFKAVGRPADLCSLRQSGPLLVLRTSAYLDPGMQLEVPGLFQVREVRFKTVLQRGRYQEQGQFGSQRKVRCV
jgi:hypothetical protein